jgi:glyoxylase-like metal-dependent hydrolase (beta-lactamase superfamily II)/ferredoxin
MARKELRLDTNVEGLYYVDSTCIDCDACRQFAPSVFERVGELSAVTRQPASDEEHLQAGKALVSCPTASIGTTERVDLATAVRALPEHVDDNVWRCGFTSEKSFGAFSYLISSAEGGSLIDSPRFSKPLLRNIESLGPVETMPLTHADDVADHDRWSEALQAKRILHSRDVTRSTRSVELQPEGDEVLEIAPGLQMIPTPGHTRGHAVFLYRDRYLFSGDHLAWSPAARRLVAFRGTCWYDWGVQTRSMERLLDFSFEWVLPGHGRPVRLEPGEMKDHLARLVAWMKTA